jgi:hypothetical protein
MYPRIKVKQLGFLPKKAFPRRLGKDDHEHVHRIGVRSICRRARVKYAFIDRLLIWLQLRIKGFSDGNAFWVTSVGDNLGLVGKGVDHAEKDWIDA